MPTARTPYEHTLSEINDINQALNVITGSGRIPGDIAAGVLAARSNLAIASSLLAIADAIRSTQPDGSQP
ncbi:hypothetical protein ACIBEA_30015 [Streptomyces sp. NPDC051555]|uniref:hypothetical protein n=1 Tax=Streptomyces sp. NPDC051555 TaxID=3365657 RepID=UPI00378D6542